jgi:hypothetical protein
MYKNDINLENFNHVTYNFSRGWQGGVTHEFLIPRERQDGTGHGVALPWWQHSL